MPAMMSDFVVMFLIVRCQMGNAEHGTDSGELCQNPGDKAKKFKREVAADAF